MVQNISRAHIELNFIGQYGTLKEIFLPVCHKERKGLLTQDNLGKGKNK